MTKVFVSMITDNDSSVVKTTAFRDREECVKHNARVAMHLAKEYDGENSDEDSEAFVEGLQEAIDNDDYDLFSSRLESEDFITDTWQFAMIELDVHTNYADIPEGELPSFNF